MELTVQRSIPGNVSIPGDLYIDGIRALYTLENKADAIPEGRYKVTIYNSPRFIRLVPLLNGVPGRSYIEIHWGNVASDYHGCIGVGLMRDLSTEEIFNTQKAFDSLFPAIETSVENEGCWINVKDCSVAQTSDVDSGDL